MAKIGCVIAYTPDHTNYGTSLQAYAMLRKIQELGHDAEVIYYDKHLSLPQKLSFIWNAVRVGELKELLLRFRYNKMQAKHPNYGNGIKERVKAVNEYRAVKVDPLIHVYSGFPALKAGSKNYDIVIVGSDQVWTPMSLPNKYFNLLFVDDNVKKVSYASSFGVSDIPKFQRKATGKYLDRFAKISVREHRGKEIVESLSNNQAVVVADPTLLLTREEWEKEIEKSKINKSEPYIFCYFLGTNPTSREAALELQKKTGLKIVTLRHMDEYYEADESFGDEAPYYVNPDDFINYIKNADYVCTDSFHCSVFSIIFHRRFMTFYRFNASSKTGRNSRIDNLFNSLGISQDHIYSGNIDNINNPIDYTLVDENLLSLRAQSLDFLKNALMTTNGISSL